LRENEKIRYFCEAMFDAETVELVQFESVAIDLYFGLREFSVFGLFLYFQIRAIDISGKTVK
jgi:hypothetical protein